MCMCVVLRLRFINFNFNDVDLRAPKRCSYLMHRPHLSDRTVGRPVRVGHRLYQNIDGVSRCGELFDLTDYGACGVVGTTKSTTNFPFLSVTLYKLSSVAAGTPATPVMRLRIKLICTLK